MVLTVNLKIIWICGLALRFWVLDQFAGLKKNQVRQFIRLEGRKGIKAKKALLPWGTSHDCCGTYPLVGML